MSLAIIHSRAQDGIDAPPVTVEVHLTNGLPTLNIVGLPEAAVRESKDRVRGALINSRFEFPTRRITINLAPADLPKDGGRYDLPIAMGILAASGQIPQQTLENYEFIGELALSGALRGVRGALTACLGLKGNGRSLVLPAANGAEAAMVSGVQLYSADHLLAVTSHFNNGPAMAVPVGAPFSGERRIPDLVDVHGQQVAKRALEVAATGGHSLLMVGPPGAGKTMLATRLPGILPDLDDDQALEVAAVDSLANSGFDASAWGQRPFRSPHHTASAVALVGGGSRPRPGEISLAHRGVLFLDELPEFDRRVLEVLREPMESGHVTISRAAHQARFPARFQFVAAMNPCPCGYLGDPRGRCTCTQEQVRRYRQRISGPLMDRIDMHIQVPPLAKSFLRPGESFEACESSAVVRERVIAAQQRQLSRSACLNHNLMGEALDRSCQLSADAVALLETALDRMGLSARAYHRVLRVARTIADMASSAGVKEEHISEAISYRDR
ncbi:MAG: YifB family Mg chelatase-like AAA ATPase [Gammaproteobacteria bacterium]|nr:YifB family Mg chelatase-like AAA ATPase [Gammaproteobacteria bacterium]